jgi:hypothetical protein
MYTNFATISTTMRNDKRFCQLTNSRFCLIWRELPPHPNVVQVFGVCMDGPQPVLVMEYCAGGTHKLKMLIWMNCWFMKTIIRKFGQIVVWQ